MLGKAGRAGQRRLGAAVGRPLEVAPAAELDRKPGKPGKRAGFAPTIAERAENIDFRADSRAERGVEQVAAQFGTRIARVEPALLARDRELDLVHVSEVEVHLTEVLAGRKGIAEPGGNIAIARTGQNSSDSARNSPSTRFEAQIEQGTSGFADRIAAVARLERRQCYSPQHDIAPGPDINEARGPLRGALDGQPRGYPASVESIAGKGPVVCAAEPVSSSDEPGVDREFAQVARQQVARDIKPRALDDFAAKRVAHDHRHLAAPGIRRDIAHSEFAGLDIAELVALIAVDQVDARRDRDLPGEAGERGRHQIGTQAVVRGDLQPAQAQRALALAARGEKISRGRGQPAAGKQDLELGIEPQQVAAACRRAAGELEPAGQRDISAHQRRRHEPGCIGASARKRCGEIVIDPQCGDRGGFAIALGRARKIDEVIAIAGAQKLHIKPLVDRVEREFGDFERCERYHATARIGNRQPRNARGIGIDRQNAILPRQLYQPRPDVAIDHNFGQPGAAARRDTLRGKPFGECEWIRLREDGRPAGGYREGSQKR